jgi:protein tyrosine phosphatase (PTP) superfamily phosphohydrolase (DUF442 family)
MRRKRLLLAGLAVVACAVLVAVGNWYWSGSGGLAAPVSKPTFEGTSDGLKHTQVVATLDEPIAAGNNAIWCASFQAAWKALQSDLAKGPVALQDGGRLVDALNNVPDPKPTIPEKCLYATAGWNHQGIIEKIHGDLKRLFPSKAPPNFPGIVENSLVAYSYLEASVKFALPYFQSREPLVFKGADGRTAEVDSFGIRKKDDYAYERLRRQAEVLYETRDDRYRLVEFAVDLDRGSKPSQIIVAVIEPGKSLAETIASLDKKIAGYQGKGTSNSGLGPNDVLLVPDVSWKISHHFTDLEGKAILNETLRGQRIDVARQDIAFRLDRSGAELRSEAKIYMKPMPTHYVADKPFLVVMKKRGAKRPYFAMWVDNAELLRPWGKAQAETAKRPGDWAKPVELEGVPNLHKVSDVLYRSAQPSTQGMANLKKKLGIKTIVNLRSFHSDRDEIGKTDLGYEHIYMKTWHPEKKEAVRFLQIVTDPKRQPVLVHCKRGADRTGTMCAIYRIAVEDWSKEDAIKEMREGGFDFDKIWSNLPKWIESLDIDEIKRRAAVQPDKKPAGP